MDAKINFRNQEQVTLFMCELRGQISDGQWENTLPRDHWHMPCDAVVAVAATPEQLGCSIQPIRKYNFAKKELWDVVADRMFTQVCLVRAFPALTEQYDEHWSWLRAYEGEDKEACESYFGYKLAEVLARVAVQARQYTMKDLRKDLKDMSAIFNTMRIAK